MKQINIFTESKYIDYLHYINQNLSFNKVKVYTAVCESDEHAIFSVAVSDDGYKHVLPKLKNLVSEIILFIYKEQFLLSKINFKSLSELYKTTLIKTLVLFDCEDDKKYIKTKLNFNNDLYLSSFYNFKLQALKKRWQEVVNLTNQNKSNFVQNDTFLDLLKFLISTMKPKADLVNVYYNNNQFEYLDSKKRKIKSNLINNEADELALITTLVALAPHHINLHCLDKLSDNTFKVIYYLFDKKVNLLV